MCTFISRIGAGIVIDALPVPPVYSRLVKNPLCTLLYEDSSQRPDDWENVSTTLYYVSSFYLNAAFRCHLVFLKTLPS